MVRILPTCCGRSSTASGWDPIRRIRILVSAVTEVEYSVQEGASVKSPPMDWKEKHECQSRAVSMAVVKGTERLDASDIPYSGALWRELVDVQRERDHDGVYRIKQGQQQALQVDQSGQK